ncbi:zinc-binding dehydrogenase [Streptomyces sp. NBC_00344]|uniref:zinc-binding dehydrogenase n=1 Tax=Streptomyces sp. NBC_00344 TaxID=2975720 RepID=UPI003FA78F45
MRGFHDVQRAPQARTKADDLVAIQGIGGLGHLGIQYAAKLGLRVVAVARGTAKEKLARELGAQHYIDSTETDPGEELSKLGGATGRHRNSCRRRHLPPAQRPCQRWTTRRRGSVRRTG